MIVNINSSRKNDQITENLIDNQSQKADKQQKTFKMVINKLIKKVKKARRTQEDLHLKLNLLKRKFRW